MTEATVAHRQDPRCAPGICSFSLVFSPGRHTAPDMAFLLVDFQDAPYLSVQRGIAFAQPLLQILVNGGFGDAKVACGGPDGGAGLDHVHSKSAGPFFNSVQHGFPSDAVCCQKILMCRSGGIDQKFLKNIYKKFTLHSLKTGL